VNCRKVLHLLSPYLDCELAPALRERVRAHLERCRQCAAEQDAMAAVAAQLPAAMPAHEPDEAFYRRLFERVWEGRQAPSLVPRLVMAVGAAAIVALVALGVLLPNANQQTTPGPPVRVAVRPARAAPAVQPPRAVEMPVVAAQPAVARRAIGSRARAFSGRTGARHWQTRRPSLPDRGSLPAAEIKRRQAQPTPQEVALVSEAIFRLRDATSDAGTAVQEATEAHSELQNTARETLQDAFQPFRSGKSTTFEVGNRHGF